MKRKLLPRLFLVCFAVVFAFFAPKTTGCASQCLFMYAVHMLFAAAVCSLFMWTDAMSYN